MRQKKNNILIVLLCGFIVLIIVWWNKQMNRYERPKGLTSYETVEQFIKAMNAGNDINGFLEQEVMIREVVMFNLLTLRLNV